MSLTDIEIYDLFEISPPEAAGLLLVGKYHFEHFLRFLPPELLQRYQEYKRLIPPPSHRAPGLKTWLTHAIKRLGLKQKELCRDLKVDPSNFSRFLNGNGSLADDHVERIYNELKIRLIAAGLLRL